MLPVTSSVAGLAAVALVIPSLRVSFARIRTGVEIGIEIGVEIGIEIGIGADVDLLRRIRAQGDFTEYVPLGLILLGLAEARQAGPGRVRAIAVLLVVGRALHAAGILSGRMPLRAAGMLGTYGAPLAGAAALAFA